MLKQSAGPPRVVRAGFAQRAEVCSLRAQASAKTKATPQNWQRVDGSTRLSHQIATLAATNEVKAAFGRQGLDRSSWPSIDGAADPQLFNNAAATGSIVAFLIVRLVIGAVGRLPCLWRAVEDPAHAQSDPGGLLRTVAAPGNWHGSATGLVFECDEGNSVE
jgi:hypothetical protein